ncbi:hypothetical protein [Butyrivibrio sp. WCE2006]|uniref:hypothetical protein n=1 Tax=Butyrivibrio sp. WCE2006 TaxID=1410611 RepID=UPI0012DFE68D
MKESNVFEKTGQTYFEIYRDFKAFTELVNKYVIHNIIENDPSGLTVQHEYYRIDTVGWKSNYKDIVDDASDAGLNPHLWDLEVAIEHENDVCDWTDEVIKLIHIKCPLKVIICYNHHDIRNENDLEKLSFVADCMNKVKAFHYGDEEYLLIIGNASNSITHKASYNCFDYRGYVLDSRDMKFSRLSVKPLFMHRK